jgi:hypothetical protein
LEFYNTQILNVLLNIAPNIFINKIKQTTQKHNPPIISNFLDNCGFDLRNTNPAIGSAIAAIIGIVYINCTIKKTTQCPYIQQAPPLLTSKFLHQLYHIPEHKSSKRRPTGLLKFP